MGGPGDVGDRGRRGWSRVAARTAWSRGCWPRKAARAAVGRGGQQAGDTWHRVCRGQWGSGRSVRPPFARTDTAPMLARDQSRTSASESSSSTNWCSRSHTPAACHARSRRHAVCPEPTPSCEGRSRQRHPVLSTNKMPSRAARSPIGDRPPGPRAGGRDGINGASSSHNRSSTNRCCCFDLATSSD